MSKASRGQLTAAQVLALPVWHGASIVFWCFDDEPMAYEIGGEVWCVGWHAEVQYRRLQAIVYPPADHEPEDKELRAAFERHVGNRDCYGLKRSRRGTYTNPAIARDWKWFRLGAAAITKPDWRKS